MKYLAEDNLELIKRFGESLAGPEFSRNIARLYSQHTRLRAGTSGLPTWTENELLVRLGEGEKLLIAGMASADSFDHRRYLRRAGEIFEWAATTSPAEIPVPVVLLAASAYQLAGYPARASGILSEHPLPNSTSKILAALLRSDFPDAHRYLIETWQLNQANETVDSRFESALLDQILRSLGVLTAWLRWGDDARIDTALTSLDKVAQALRYDSDRFSWLLAVLFASIGQGYKRDALWTVLSPLLRTVTDDGRQAFARYTRAAFLEKKMLAWPSQQAGISGIVSEGSFALCTPTGSGKTRVAELVILRHLFGQVDNHSTSISPFVLYLAPSRALSAEVEAGLSRSLRRIQATSVAVTSLYGGNDFGPSDLTSTVEQPTVLISTHEKADALLRFLGPTMMGKVSCVIIDEAHTAAFTGDYQALTKAQSRSLRLESLVSRLRTLCPPSTIFVALSAVAAEIRDVLSSWVTGIDERCAIAPDYRSTRQLFGRLLCTETGTTTIQYDVLDGLRLEIEDKDSAPYVPNPFPPHPTVTNTFRGADSIEKRMRAHLLWAAMHFTQPSDGKRHSVLISVTEHPEWYAETFLNLLTGDWANSKCPDFFTPPEDGRSQSLLSRCQASCADYFGSESREYRLLERGIVLHHGKMPPVMSRLLIELVQSGVINIVIATSTLSEGVNLPFETVLIPSLKRRKSVVDAKEIINVAGRAGRPGVSTEGRTLVLLPSVSRSKSQRRSMQAYLTIVKSMTSNLTEALDSPHSSLYALIDFIEQKWRHVSRSTDRVEFINWLETTAYSAEEGEHGELLKSLDTLDQQLLTAIEEAQSLKEETDVEEFLQLLWRNTLARHDSNSHDNQIAHVFKRRGMALTNTIYPERSRRKGLYYTGLPPRDGSYLIDQLSDIKGILQEAVNYATWGVPERIKHFTRLVETTSQIETFGIRDLKIGNAVISWSDILVWWMAPDTATHRPNPNSVSRWYDFASKYFIYGLNWALGAVIGSILERDGGDGKILERWSRCELPWSVLWYKDMVSWGTLDPIASYALTRNEAYTRSVATEIAAEYWEAIDEINDAVLDPKRVAEWMNIRGEARSTAPEDQHLPQSEISVKLTDDFSRYRGAPLRVLPGTSEHLINWFDPAGFLLAQSDIPENWHRLKATETDFLLDPESTKVTWKPYI